MARQHRRVGIAAVVALVAGLMVGALDVMPTAAGAIVDPRGVYALVSHRLVPCCQDFPHTLNIVNYEPATGQIHGTGTQPDFGFFGALSGSNIDLHVVYNNSSYVADLAGTMGSDGSMSGTFTDNLNQSGTWTAAVTQLGLSWSLAKEFGANPTANPPPDSYGNFVWTFRQSSSFAHDLNYSLLPHYSNQFAGVSGLDAWYGDITTGTCTNFVLPVIGINATSVNQNPPPCSPPIPAGAVFVHPANPQMAIVSWQSPTSGTVNITGGVTDDDPRCGDGIRWYVDQDAATLASGAIPNGGSASFPTGLQATVHNGSALYFIVDPGASGNIDCDTTRLDVTIVAGTAGTPAAITLGPPATACALPCSTNLTATVLSNSGLPVAGVQVTLSVTGGAILGVKPTDSSGVATFSVSGASPGAEAVQASFSNNGIVTTSNVVTLRFAGITLQPSSQGCPRPCSAQLTVTAVDLASGSLVANWTVTSGPDAGMTGSVGINNVTNQGYFSLQSRATRGTDLVIASFIDSNGVTHQSNAATVLIGRPPSPARGVRVRVGNGNATVTWKPPGNAGSFPVDSYLVTAAPLANDRVPAPSAPPVTATVPATTTSYTLGGLVADCHQTYTFSVTAHNAIGSSPPRVAAGGPYRPSGNISQSGDPPLVVLLVDGKSYIGPTTVAGFTPYNPLQPTISPPPPSGIQLQPTISPPFTYCPEAPWDGVSTQAPTWFVPALQDFLGEANGVGWNWGLPPQNFTSGTPTHLYMLDPLAAIGAVVIPYGYPSGQATLVRLKNGKPKFTFPGYTTDNNSDPYKEAATLASEVGQINKVWPSSPIVIIGHSHGGVIAYLYWGGTGFGSGVRTSGVTHIFSLDSPINGTRVCGAFGAVFCNTVTGNLYATLWDSQANLDHLAIQNDSDQSFTPIGTAGDLVFDNSDSPVNGIASQILFNCSGFPESCDPAYPPDVNSLNCAITAQTTGVVAGLSHFAVRICPDYIATIARDASVPVP